MTVCLFVHPFVCLRLFSIVGQIHFKVCVVLWDGEQIQICYIHDITTCNKYGRNYGHLEDRFTTCEMVLMKFCVDLQVNGNIQIYSNGDLF